MGYLEDAQGCGTCVCVVPPVIMETDGVQRDPANVEFGTGSSWAPSSGRVVFSFHWDFDDPAIEDEEHFVNLSIETQDYVLLGMEEVQTFHLPSSDPPFSIEAYRASYISAQAFPLTLIDGYLTIYPSTSTEYSGGVYLVLETAAGVQVIVAGPFDGNEA